MSVCLFSQWFILKGLWVKLPCPHVFLLAGPLVPCTQSKLRVLRRWPLEATDDCVKRPFSAHLTGLSLFFTTGAKRHQTTAAGGPQQNRKGAMWRHLHAFSFTLWCPNKVLCSSVVHGSTGGGGEGQDENHSAAWGRGEAAGGRDSEESGPHLLTAATPRVPVSYFVSCVNDMESKFIKQVHLFA